MVKGLKGKIYKERLRSFGLLSLEKAEGLSSLLSHGIQRRGRCWSLSGDQ